MKTLEQVVDRFGVARVDEYIGAWLDGRDRVRLGDFLPVSAWPVLGLVAREGVSHEPLEWTEGNVREQLARDVAFGFEKALDKRGISASLMYQVVLMWLWVLDDPLFAEFSGDNEPERYPQYGLPLLKAVALKFGFPNPIGQWKGTEYRFMR